MRSCLGFFSFSVFLYLFCSVFWALAHSLLCTFPVRNKVYTIPAGFRTAFASYFVFYYFTFLTQQYPSCISSHWPRGGTHFPREKMVYCGCFDVFRTSTIREKKVNQMKMRVISFPRTETFVRRSMPFFRVFFLPQKKICMAFYFNSVPGAPVRFFFRVQFSFVVQLKQGDPFRVPPPAVRRWPE